METPIFLSKISIFKSYAHRNNTNIGGREIYITNLEWRMLSKLEDGWTESKRKDSGNDISLVYCVGNGVSWS